MAAPPHHPVLDSRRFGRTPVGFIAVLAACCLIALLALIVVLAQRGPAPALIGLLLALVPIPLVLAVVLYLDRLEPEPRALLAAMFGTGAGVAAVIALAGRALGTGVITVPELGPDAGQAVPVTFGTALGGAIFAETLNGAVLVALLRSRRTEIDGSHDGVVYASMVGLGFALVANVYAYLAAESSGVGALAEAFGRRGILGPLWQPLFTSMIGLGVSHAASRRGSERYWAIGAGWVAAVVLDTLWNDSVSASGLQQTVSYLILVAALVAVVALVVADRQRVVGMITHFLPDYAEPTVMTAPDIAMLASLRLRRLGRQWARLHFGLVGMRAMSEYQLAATELAMACNRHLDGRTTDEAFELHRDDSLFFMRAAAEVVRERHPPAPPPWILIPNGPSAFLKKTP
jgi:RsiW-degrading membrane proteinase PrsW (M82 family)